MSAVEEILCVVLQRGHSGHGYDLASTLCKFDLRKGDLFVLSWARVRRVMWGSISSELLVCGGGVRSILLLPLVARCLETINVYMWCMFVVVTMWGVCGNVCCVADIVENSVFLTLECWKYAVCLCRGCDGCCVFCRCSCMGSLSVSSCRCCMFVSCVHPVAVLNAAFCMTCSLLMLVEDLRGDHMEEEYSIAGLIVSSHYSVSFHAHPGAVRAFMICRGLCACTEMLWMLCCM